MPEREIPRQRRRRGRSRVRVFGGGGGRFWGGGFAGGVAFVLPFCFDGRLGKEMEGVGRGEGLGVCGLVGGG